MRAEQILDDQVIHVKRGRLNGLGFEPAFNSYFDFYLDGKYFGEALLELQDVTFHLYLRKNINDTNRNWKMPTLRQMKQKFGISYDKIYAMFDRLERAHLLNKQSGVRVGTANVRNAYIVSDPITTLGEFLEVASQGLFTLPLLPEYQAPEEAPDVPEIGTSGAPEIGTFRVPEIGTLDVPEIGADQQTLNTKQTGGQTVDIFEKKLWENVLTQLQQQLPSATFISFLADTQLDRIEGAVAVITTNRAYAKEWLDTRMSNKLRKLLGVELRLSGRPAIDTVRCEMA